MAEPGNRRGSDRKSTQAPGSAASGKRLADLTDRLSHARGRHTTAPATPPPGNPMGVALRTATELIAGVLVGGLIGWQLDSWFGTSPAMLIIFLLLGAAAGIWNVIRAALKMQSGAQDAGTGADKSGSPSDSA